MAATKAKEETVEKKDIPVDPMKQYVSVYLPRASKSEQNFVFVSLNGKGYDIMKGQQVRVPRPVADILAESNRMTDRQMQYQDEVSKR